MTRSEARLAAALGDPSARLQVLSTRLRLSQRTVETHVRNIFMKLGIPESTDYHRRVLAVLTLLRAE